MIRPPFSPVSHQDPPPRWYFTCLTCAILLFSFTITACSHHRFLSHTSDPDNYPKPGIAISGTPPETITSYPNDFTGQQLASCHAFVPPALPHSMSSQELVSHWFSADSQGLSPHMRDKKKRGHLRIGVTLDAAPFSYMHHHVQGFLVSYGFMLNHWLYHGGQPEFKVIRGEQMLRQALNENNVDVVLVPTPLSCQQRQYLEHTIPFYNSALAMANMRGSKPTSDTHGNVCITDDPIERKVTYQFYPKLTQIVAENQADCQVIAQQGRAQFIVGLQEPLLTIAQQSAFLSVTPFFRLFVAGRVRKGDTELVALIDAAQRAIRANPAAQNTFEKMFINYQILPDTSSIHNCIDSLSTIQNSIAKSANLVPLFDDMRRNFEVHSPIHTFKQCEKTSN